MKHNLVSPGGWSYDSRLGELVLGFWLVPDASGFFSCLFSYPGARIYNGSVRFRFSAISVQLHASAMYEVNFIWLLYFNIEIKLN